MSQSVTRVMEPGDAFRDWLVNIAGDRVKNKTCRVLEVPISPASHVVCKYVFDGENSAVIGKFFGLPTGKNSDYDAAKAMKNEYRLLKHASKAICNGRPLGKNAGFDCVLVTWFVKGKSFGDILRTENGKELMDRIAMIARLHRRLHTGTVQSYDKEREFANFHEVLNDLHLPHHTRERFNELLGRWWYSPLLDRKEGCMIHRDATPSNYIFSRRKVTAIDFESSWEGAHPAHDLGIFCAEIAHYFTRHKNAADKGMPYIDRYLRKYSMDKKELQYISHVLPFHMALGFLRIARLYFGSEYYHTLVWEAKNCLRSRV